MAARTPVLDKTDLFGTLPPELLEQLRGRTALGRYRRGDAIFEKGDVAHSLYVCFSGRVAIVAKASDGRESVLTVLGPGALFGEMSMFDGGVRCGQDVLKALALGAKGTMIGRAFLYGLGAMGEEGVRRTLELIANELSITMAFTGHTDIRNVDRGVLLPDSF